MNPQDMVFLKRGLMQELAKRDLDPFLWLQLQDVEIEEVPQDIDFLRRLDETRGK